MNNLKKSDDVKKVFRLSNHLADEGIHIKISKRYLAKQMGGGGGNKHILKVNKESVTNFMIPKKSCTKLAMTRKQTQ